MTPLVLDPEGQVGPGSDQRPFGGYDDVLLKLERGFERSAIIELIGLAGSGKSAVAREFGRWMAFIQAPRFNDSTVSETNQESTLLAYAQIMKGNLAVLVTMPPHVLE
jgi:hypothetical protein